MRFISALMISVLFLNLNHLNAQSNPPPISTSLPATLVASGRISPPFSITIERHPENRKAIFQWDCVYGEGGLTEKQLYGEKSQRIFQSSQWPKNVFFEYGQCEVMITVQRSNGEDISFRKEINVIGSPGL